MNIIVATIFAHMLSDFIFQSDETAIQKSKLMVKGFLKHFLGIFLSLFIVLQLQFTFLNVLLYSFGISIVHIGIDLIKVLIQKKINQKHYYRLFVVDQTLHIIAIVVIVNLFGIKFYYNDYFTNSVVPVFNSNIPSNWQIDGYKLFISAELYLIVFILFGIGAGIFIGHFIKPYRPDDIQEGEVLNSGKYIGIIERFVIITLTILNQYSAIAFIVAAKSLARHEGLNKKGFAEYYLLGTLSSIFVAISGGELLKCAIQLVK